MKSIIKLSAWIVLTSTLAACGGGSAGTQPGSASVQPTAPAVVEKATVGIILTDAGVDDYDHAYATITSVELLGDSGDAPIFSGEETVDLLALTDTVQLFAVNDNVDPGDYSKIRMIASSLVLAVDHEDGSTTETVVELVANGKIDLNPRGTFSIAAGDVVFVSLDWDMKESLKLTETGNGKIKMRPVIFVDIGTEPAFKEGLVRVSGVVDLVAKDFTSFRICSPDVVAQVPADPILSALCLDIIINGKTGLFGEKGTPVMVSDLMKGDPVAVLGLLQRTMDGPAVTPLEDENGAVEPTPFQVLAIVVEGGAPGTWQQLRGSLKSSVDDKTDAFGFLVDSGQGFPDDTVLTGQLFDMTRIFSISLDTGVTEIMAADLMAEDRAVIDSVQVPADTDGDPDVLRIAIMLVRPPGDIDRVSIKGELLSVDAAAGTLMIAAGSADRCVTTDDDTKIFQLFLTDDSLESVPATLAELTVGSKIDVTGEEGGCFAADLIIAEGQSATPL